ncbi:RNA-binding protein 28 [Aedes albopictus]|uniref:RRM domain-containing protein n=1 Tax=Aedes albopictus TaxID=7160 RepID=A0ABM1YVG5_AEDAL
MSSGEEDTKPSVDTKHDSHHHHHQDQDEHRGFSKNAIRKRSREFAHHQNRIIVRNVSYKITDKLLRSEFEKYGTLEEVNILKRPDGRLVGCVFLQYTKREESDRAIQEMDGNIFMGRKLQICYAQHKGTYKKAKTETEVKTEEIKQEDDDIQETEIKEESDEDEAEEEEEDDDDVEDEDDEDDDDEDDDKEDVKEALKDVKLEVTHQREKNHHEIEEGRTVFLKNVPYDADESSIKDVLSQFGTVEKVLINKERASGHSKGTAFVIFKLMDSAEMSRKQSLKIQINDQFVEILEALKKKQIRDKESKDKVPKDSRNLYLLKEGVIMAGSPSAKEVSKSDMAQRLQLEQRCAQMLKNLNRFVSRERLTIHNLPANYTNNDLRQMVLKHAGKNPNECRVMRENKPSFGNPSGQSRGYGFLSFKAHATALEVLRKLNNNPSVFGKNRRPIVSFSIEDRKVHNIKQQRMLKSRLNNPTYQQKLEKIRAKKIEKLIRKKEHQKNAKEQMAIVPSTQFSAKHAKAGNPKPATKERRRNIIESTEDFSGEISRKGKVGIRSNRKINTQAEAHVARLKAEKKEARKKRVKQQHERNRNLKASRRAQQKQPGFMAQNKEDRYFQQTVGKYKEMISQATSNASARNKWYSE